MPMPEAGRVRRRAGAAETRADLQEDLSERTYLDMTRDELDARMEAMEARSDARFERLFAELRASNAELRSEIQTSTAESRGSYAELRGDIRSLRVDMNARIDALAARSVDKVTAAGLLAAAVALIFSLVAYGGDQFGAGREVSTAIAALDAKIDRIGADRHP